MADDGLIYAGFWRRVGAFLVDLLIFLPLGALFIWLSGHYRLFHLYYFVPGQILCIFYYVYLVQKYGGTPGKLILKIKIAKLDGSPVTYREAILRYLPEFILQNITSIALILAILRITDSEYLSLSYIERSKTLMRLTPPWYEPAQLIQNIWIWSEFVVLLTNSKKRAIHDFIAGTVVIHNVANPISASESQIPLVPRII